MHKHHLKWGGGLLAGLKTWSRAKTQEMAQCFMETTVVHPSTGQTEVVNGSTNGEAGPAYGLLALATPVVKVTP